MILKDLKSILAGADDNSFITFDGREVDFEISIIKTYKKSTTGAFGYKVDFKVAPTRSIDLDSKK